MRAFMDQLCLISEITSKKFSGRNSIKERLAWVFSYNAISDIVGIDARIFYVELFISINKFLLLSFLAFKTPFRTYVALSSNKLQIRV